MSDFDEDNWEVVCDNNVRNYWKCPECNDGAIVSPDEYQNIGTPVCSECDCDMDYVYTEVKCG